MGLSNATHAISAVTGACLVLKRSRFKEVGGFDEKLAVAFNDVLLCMELSNRGYRNIYVGHPLMIHFESKTRGFDDTEAKQQLFRQEARYARRKNSALFKNDPFYNSNLSLEKAYDLAFPPRVEKPWHRFRRQSTGRLRVLMLSSTHQVGHGVSVVVNLQARHLAAEGHTVFVGGPLAKNEFQYPGCSRVYLDGPKDAAIFAFQESIDCVVMHTPPFYSTARWLGATVKTLAYDYGEPDPDFFPDAEARKVQLQEKAFCLEMADALYAISDAVKAEAPHEQMGVIPLGNSHLARWDEHMTNRRKAKRAEFGFGDSIVVLNVCRFHEGERHYKGVDEYCNVRIKLSALNPARANDFVFVLAGKGTEADVMEMEACGLRVFANISDEELVDLYCCADLYANFSRWEGYNLGIGQALAFGLPVVASDIPAHRAFGVFVSNESAAAAKELVALADTRDRTRIVKLTEWTEPLKMFSEAIAQLNSLPPAHSSSTNESH
jgi:glycosyltransferase involved in cell wall biosynthesis